MKDTKIYNGIEQIKKIKMTDIEKNQILERIVNSPLPIKSPVASPWFKYYPISFFLRNRKLSYVLVSCLIIILSSQKIVSASERSLPGNIFYNVKVNIVEPIHATFTFSTQAKAEYEIGLATKRLKEAEVLALENKLDEVKQKQINSLLETHTEALNKDLLKLKKDESQEKVDDIATNFQAQMNAHAKVIDIIEDNNNINQINNQKTDNQKYITKTARNNGSKIRNNFENKDSGVITNKYENKKKNLRLLIDSTTDELNSTSINTPEAKEKIVDDTHKTINQAKQFLEEADKEDLNKNSQNAYRALLDSESSLKEANIFIKTGLELNLKRNE